METFFTVHWKRSDSSRLSDTTSRYHTTASHHRLAPVSSLRAWIRRPAASLGFAQYNPPLRCSS